MSRARYGKWAGGPDPLEPPYDIRAALDEIGDDVLSGMSPRAALNRLLRRGADGPHQRFRTDDELGRPGDERQQQDARPQLAGQVP